MGRKEFRKFVRELDKDDRSEVCPHCFKKTRFYVYKDKETEIVNACCLKCKKIVARDVGLEPDNFAVKDVLIQLSRGVHSWKS